MAGPRKAPFRFWRFFFSLQGRVSRVPFLACELSTRLGLFASYQALSHIPNLGLATKIAYTVPLTVISLIVLWPNFALMFKRFHDAGLPGLWSLVYFAPSLYGGYAAMSRIQAIQHQHALSAMPPYVNWGLIAFNYGLVVIAFLLPSHKATNRYGPRPGYLADQAQDVF